MDVAPTGSGLADQPIEIVEHIMYFMSRPNRSRCTCTPPNCDVGCCVHSGGKGGDRPRSLLLHGPHKLATALASPVSASLALRILPKLSRGELARLVGSGAPLALLQRYQTKNGTVFEADHLKCAVEGGRLDVCQWIHDEVYMVKQESRCVCRCNCGKAKKSVTFCGGNADALLQEAALHNRPHIVSWVLESCAIDCIDIAPCVIEALLEGTTCSKYGGVFRQLHDYRARNLVGDGRTCACSKSMAVRVVYADNLSLWQWLCERHCTATTDIGAAWIMDNAMLYDSEAFMRWIAQHVPWGAPNLATASMLATQVIGRSSNAFAVAIAHDYGFCVFDERLLILASRKNHLCTLEWACGELAVDTGYQGAHVAPHWDAALVAPILAGCGNADCFEWMLTRDDLRRALTPCAARVALNRYCLDRVITMHTLGLVPLTTWDALDVAVSMGPRILGTLIDAGAPFTRASLERAFTSMSWDAVEVLCDRFGYDHLQNVIDDTQGRACLTRFEGIAALDRLARGRVCVMPLWRAFCAYNTDISFGDIARIGCRCARCADR